MSQLCISDRYGSCRCQTDDVKTRLDGPNGDRQAHVALPYHDNTTRRCGRNAVQGDPRLVVTISDHSNTTGVPINRHPLFADSLHWALRSSSQMNTRELAPKRAERAA